MVTVLDRCRKARNAALVASLALAVAGCNSSRTHTGSVRATASPSGDPCAQITHPGSEIDCNALASYGLRGGEGTRVEGQTSLAANVDPALRSASAGDFATPERQPTAQGLGLRGVDGAPAATGAVRAPAARTYPAAHTQAPARTHTGYISLGEAVGLAVERNPEIGYQDAKAYDAYYGIRVAQSRRKPQVDGSIGVGYRVDGTWSNSGLDLYKDGGAQTRGALDASLQLKQLLYDFGSTRSDIDRARFVYVMERFKREAKIEDVVFETISAYLTLLEQQALLKAARDNVKAHDDFEQLVRLNEANGNGTKADVNRVVARKVDAQTLLTDLQASSEDAADRFRRLTQVDPGNLAAPPSVDHAVPPRLENALAMLPDQNPLLLSIRANTAASEMELASHRAAGLPTINLEVDGTSNNYIDRPGVSELEMKGMVVMRQRLLDGGRRRSEGEQIRSRVSQHQYRYQHEMEDLEADLRQYYRAIDSSRAKARDLKKGLDSSRKVRELYTEQFRAGQRTVFELLDSQSSLFSDESDLINNRYDAVRSQFRILRAIGMLSQSVHTRR
ncbi:TolC family protein [Tepidamorphus sp. 3E244]|uniref:TolC family protein n=1 Tax=Tepidamorphus sp. 3E244 TaxID=3385498 RepID=UPI0038FBE50C